LVFSPHIIDDARTHIKFTTQSLEIALLKTGAIFPRQPGRSGD